MGNSQGTQVWATTMHQSLIASIYRLPGESPIVLLSEAVIGTPEEGKALAWALEWAVSGAGEFAVRQRD
jgi:hypothetical protein